MNNKKEIIEKNHYNKFVYIKTKKDTNPSSSLCRKYIINKVINSIPEKNFKIKTILDIGCGIGANAVYLDGYYEKYIGVDFSDKMIEVAKKFTNNVNNVSFIVSNVKSLKISTMSEINVVLMDGALHHMTQLEEVFTYLKKIIRPETIFLAREPQNGSSFFQLLRKIRMKVDKSYSKHQIFFSEIELFEIMQKCQMKDIQFSYQGLMTPPLSQIVIRPNFIIYPIVKLLLGLEKILDKFKFMQKSKITWNVIIYAKF